MAASATSLPAAKPATESNISRAQLPIVRVTLIIASCTLQIVQPARAVADAVLVNVELVQYAQQQIARRDGLGRIGKMTPAFEFSVQSSDQHMRHIVVKVLI